MPFAGASFTKDPTRITLALRYSSGGIVLAVIAAYFGGSALWLAWISGSLLLVALIYAFFGPLGFQKNSDGGMSAASLWLFAPYFIGAWINSRLWTHRTPASAEVVPGLWIGRVPGLGEPQSGRMRAIVDLSAELPCRVPATRYASIPMLDLVIPTIQDLGRAAQAIDATRNLGPTLVCCALGYSRSATAVAAWLLLTGQAASASEAIESVRRVRPSIVLTREHLAALEKVAANRSASPRT